MYLVKTKGLEDLAVPPKMHALKQWCIDVNKSQKKNKVDFVFVDEERFNKYEAKSFDEIINTFKEHR